MKPHNLYSDGNYFPRAKKSGFGGYIESPDGDLIIEYSEQIKQPEYAFSFELLGIIRGLQIAKAKKITSIISHCDDKNTTSKLKEIFEDNNFNVSPGMKPELYMEIIELSKSFKEIKFEYIPRTKNRHADSLSRRYATLMEENFLRRYNKEIDFSEEKLANGGETKKRIFFSHPAIVRNINKNNPYLIANIRNKKVRKVSRTEENKQYDFLFIESFKVENEIVLRSFHYDNTKTIKNKYEIKFNETENFLENYCSFTENTIEKIKKENSIKNLWINSNYSIINNYFEQKEKLPNNTINDFLKIHKSLNGLNNVFFHHLPFNHQFSPEILSFEKKKEKLDHDIYSLENLIEQLKNSNIKEHNKCFGAIIRHQLRNYKTTLEREINDIEKTEIIAQTVLSLQEKGYTGTPRRWNTAKQPLK